ncbi:unnamed protein product [Trifolium pratense]|uniref:Uncharacterized protein n=1 Tax=Trifolium pratense TaxID=57577 RepID=A0ACB0K6N4_TRIPR|nr:unnamed protein product [Trifolium pratense]
MDRYEELTRAIYASLEAACAALDSHLSDKGYIVTVLHTRRVGHNKDAVHSQGRALTGEQRQEIIQAAIDRQKPIQIVVGRSPLVALLDGPEDRPKATYFAQFDDQRQLTHLLIISPSAKEICYRFSAGKIWLIDSTYKTNRFGLPLMHIVGVTATHQTFTFVYCFMAGERIEDYLWALRHIQQVFAAFLFVPKTFVTDCELALMNALSVVFSDNGNVDFLLCQWHINKNIFSRQHRIFANIAAFEVLEQHWNSLVRSKTAIEYDEKLTKMREFFPHHVMVYLEETWLLYKNRFVAIFIRNKLYFGHTTTLRVESAHATVKSWITVSTGDLLTVKTACQLTCNNQLAIIRLQTGRERASTSLGYGSVFAAITGNVSFAALKIAYQQSKLRLGISLEDGDENDVECHGLFTSNIEMPCRHKPRQAAAATPPNPPRVLSVDDFDSHWWLVQPLRQDAVSVAPTSIEEILKCIQEEYEEGTSNRRLVILDHLDALPAAEVFNPSIQHGRGRPVGSHRHQ